MKNKDTESISRQLGVSRRDFIKFCSVVAAGMGLHGLADALNPWGVAPLWPLNRIGQTWNLVHEGDQGFLVAAAVCAVVALLGGVRTIVLSTVVVGLLIRLLTFLLG